MKKINILLILSAILFFSLTNNTFAKSMKNPVVMMKTSMGDITIELFQDAAPETVKNFIGLAQGEKEFTDLKTGKKIKKHFYDGLKFHRVIKDFMIQGGCPLGNGQGNPGYTFKDEINGDILGLSELTAYDKKTGPHPFLGIRSQEDFNRLIMAPLVKKLGILSNEDFQKRKNEFNEKLFSMSLKEAYEISGYTYSKKLKSVKPLKGHIAMANSGPDTNGSQFFINLIDTPWLTGKHTVFGKVIKGMGIIEKIGLVKTGTGSMPEKDIKILSVRVIK